MIRFIRTSDFLHIPRKGAANIPPAAPFTLKAAENG